MKYKIFVTGSNGFIGSNLIKYLKKKNFEIYGCDNKNLKENSKFIKSDFFSKKTINFIKNNNIDFIIHLAATTEIKNNQKNSIKCINNNFIKTKNFLKELKNKKIKIKKFIFASSAAVYGLSSKKKLIETSTKNPISAYGKSKLMAERFINKNAFFNIGSIFLLRFFNVTGGNMMLNKKKTFFNNLYNSYVKKNFFYIYGNDHCTKDGTPVRDFIDIKKISLIIEKIIIKPSQNKVHTFNIGSGIGISLLEVIKYLLKKKIKIKYSYKKKKIGDISYSISNNQKIIKYLKKIKLNFNFYSQIKKDFKIK